MRRRILLTGSAGLIGRALGRELEARDWQVVGLDIRDPGPACGDVRDRERVARALADCDGVVHLATVSRVITAQRDPELCWDTNVGGVRTVLGAALESPRRPWVLFASSREVYGQPERLPATEDTPRSPVNIYGRSKVEGEDLVLGARGHGLVTAVVRLSNVFGSVEDHADRVVPAFVRGALQGEELRIDGPEHTFDFTYIDDVTRGIALMCDQLDAGRELPPVHFVSGQPTTLGQLARLAIDIAGTSTTVRHARPRDFDVARFYGSFDRARALFGWAPEVPLVEGMKRLMNGYRARLGGAMEAGA